MYKDLKKVELKEVEEKYSRMGVRNLTDYELILSICKTSEAATTAYNELNAHSIIDNKTLTTAFELARRYGYTAKGRVISCPSDIYAEIKHFAFDTNQERFIMITLNGAHEVIKSRVITQGLLNRTLVHPREVFSPALTDNANAIVIAHNHPSGNVIPSSDDMGITKRLAQCGELLGIKVLDHLVFSDTSYYSFVEHEEL